jgi:hypothetical protein
VWAPFNLINILLQNKFIKDTKLGHKYGATKAQLFIKANGAQSSIDKKKYIPPKDIGNRV